MSLSLLTVTTYSAGLPTVTPCGPAISTFSAALLLVADVLGVDRAAVALVFAEERPGGDVDGVIVVMFRRGSSAGGEAGGCGCGGSAVGSGATSRARFNTECNRLSSRSV